MQIVNRLFPYKVCINLDRRKDRWKRVQFKFRQQDIVDVRRFSAIDGALQIMPKTWTHTSGALGCLLSHLQVVRDARDMGIKRILIFEDDVVFEDSFKDMFARFKVQLPSDWDIVYFGAIHMDEPISVSENIVRVGRAYSTYAYALNETVFDAFIELNSELDSPVDVNNFILQKRFNCYCFYPHLAWVEAEYSDIQQRLEDHWYLRKSLVLFGNDTNRLLSETALIIVLHGDNGNQNTNRNLLYLIDFYHEFFSPYLSITIVEQSSEPTIDSRCLPPGCEYIAQESLSQFDRWQCFLIGVSSLSSQKKYCILSDSRVYIEPMNIRANLHMCEEYDAVTGFTKLYPISHNDTLQLQENGHTRGLDVPISDVSGEHDCCCCFIRRKAFFTLKTESVSSLLECTGRHRVFDSPNHGLLLYDGSLNSRL